MRCLLGLEPSIRQIEMNLKEFRCYKCEVQKHKRFQVEPMKLDKQLLIGLEIKSGQQRNKLKPQASNSSLRPGLRQAVELQHSSETELRKLKVQKQR